MESLTMTFTSTVVGVLISDPHRRGRRAQCGPALGSIYICRSIIAASRALQEIIVAIFFVALFGLGLSQGS
jgi:phosphonate transport system permease protein